MEQHDPFAWAQDFAKQMDADARGYRTNANTTRRSLFGLQARDNALNAKHLGQPTVESSGGGSDTITGYDETERLIGSDDDPDSQNIPDNVINMYNLKQLAQIDPEGAKTYAKQFNVEHAPMPHGFMKVRPKIDPSVAPLIEEASAKYGVPADVMKRQITQESGGKYRAPNEMGAEGIAQFVPGTARQYKVNVKDTASSIDGQGRYMRDLLKQFGGNMAKALAAYNWGPGNMERWLKRGADPAHMPAETRNYVKIILGD